MTRWDSSAIPDQSGRTVVVTGASSGLGLLAAEALAGAGGRVVLGCRHAARGEAARQAVAAGATGPPPEVVAIDLADLASLRAAAAEIAERFGAVDVLMNNAGIMAVPLTRTADGFEAQFATNHLGHFALTGLVLPLLLAAPGGGRVVTTSSNVHRQGRNRWDDANWETTPYRRWRAYGQSKLANLLFMSELGRRAAAAGTGLVSAAGHPGYAATHLQGASAAATGPWPVAKAMGLASALGNLVVAQSDAAGALPQLYAATMPDVASGDYFGPRGPGEMRGSPTRVGMSPSAQDAAAAGLLWDVSEDLTGVTYPWPAGPSPS